MKRLFVFAAVALAITATSAPVGLAQTKGIVAFGALDAVSPEIAKEQAREWLKQSAKVNGDMMQQFETIWQQDHHSVLDRLASTLALGDQQAAALLTEARNPLTPAPTKVPELITNDKAPKFFRANLALAYAQELVHRRVYEEALAALNTVKAEDVIDPSSYLFHRAVCEHGMLKKTEAKQSISRLLEDVIASPERYKTVSILMLLDMQTWKDKDLGDIARKMDNIERRLELARGGPETQKLQKEVIRRLDELIKKKENEAKNQQQGGGQPNGGSCPDGSAPGDGNNPGNNGGSKPRPDSTPGGPSGTGKVDDKKFKDLAIRWGELPERERAEALQELTEGLSQNYRQIIENYFRNIAKESQN